MKFQVGDQVICINNDNAYELTIGKKYTIINVRDLNNHVVLNGFHGVYFYSKRFQHTYIKEFNDKLGKLIHE